MSNHYCVLMGMNEVSIMPEEVLNEVLIHQSPILKEVEHYVILHTNMAELVPHDFFKF